MSSNIFSNQTVTTNWLKYCYLTTEKNKYSTKSWDLYPNAEGRNKKNNNTLYIHTTEYLVRLKKSQYAVKDEYFTRITCKSTIPNEMENLF